MNSPYGCYGSMTAVPQPTDAEAKAAEWHARQGHDLGGSIPYIFAVGTLFALGAYALIIKSGK